MDNSTTIFKNGMPFILTNADPIQFVDGEVYPALSTFVPSVPPTEQTAEAWIS
jgi:hypothetical protein